MKVTFTQPTQHDAKVFMPGDKADLPNAAAKALIDCGSAEASDSAKARAEAEAAAKEAAEKLASEQAAAEELAKAEKAALQAWDNDAALREQHGNDFPTYMASLSKAD